MSNASKRAGVLIHQASGALQRQAAFESWGG